MTIASRFRSPRVLACACMLLPLACVDGRVVLEQDEGSSSGDPSTTTSPPPPTTEPPSPSTTSPEPADDTTATDSSSTGIGFIEPVDAGSEFYECSLFQQDCPPGEKCMPWSNGGGGWNATRCSPIAEDPAGIDAPCMVEGSWTSGIDDCALGLMCWDVDPETNEGHCVPLCIGSEENPYCADPMRECAIASDGVIALCLPVCNPIAQDCPEGQACYPIQDEWSCAPDASGDMGVYGDPCEFINVCDPGLICLNAETVPPGQACEGAAGCCTEICDLSDPLGDAQCAGAAEGQTCQPWYEEGAAPPFYENVGACALP